MNSRLVALATSERGRELDPDLPILQNALAEQEVAAEIVLWDDPGAVWSDYGLTIVRSCGDYTWRLDDFQHWTRSVPRLANPADVIAWNVDKRYVQALADRGCRVVPTVWNPCEINELPQADEWVVKPTISAGSRDTARWSDPRDALKHAGELVSAGRTAMVQPYLRSVDAHGERALLFFDGQFSHAVRKGALLRRGEGVVQTRDSRSDLRPIAVDQTQVEFASGVLAAAMDAVGTSEVPLYARIDLVDDDQGQPRVLELELTEPSLFLPQSHTAARRFAGLVCQRLDGSPSPTLSSPT